MSHIHFTTHVSRLWLFYGLVYYSLLQVYILIMFDAKWLNKDEESIHLRLVKIFNLPDWYNSPNNGLDCR